MESVVRVEASEKDIEEILDKRLLNVRFYAFDVKENGFDQRILTREQREEGMDEAWTYVLRIRHADFGSLEKRYESVIALIRDVNNRGSAYADSLRKRRRKEAKL